jgi:hypothetical protein
MVVVPASALTTEQAEKLRENPRKSKRRPKKRNPEPIFNDALAAIGFGAIAAIGTVVGQYALEQAQLEGKGAQVAANIAAGALLGGGLGMVDKSAGILISHQFLTSAGAKLLSDGKPTVVKTPSYPQPQTPSPSPPPGDKPLPSPGTPWPPQLPSSIRTPFSTVQTLRPAAGRAANHMIEEKRRMLAQQKKLAGYDELAGDEELAGDDDMSGIAADDLSGVVADDMGDAEEMSGIAADDLAGDEELGALELDGDVGELLGDLGDLAAPDDEMGAFDDFNA